MIGESSYKKVVAIISSCENGNHLESAYKCIWLWRSIAMRSEFIKYKKFKELDRRIVFLIGIYKKKQLELINSGINIMSDSDYEEADRYESYGDCFRSLRHISNWRLKYV